MLLPHAPEVALAEVGADERGPLEEQANLLPTAEVVRLIEALDGALGRMKRGGDPKLELELSFLKLTRDYTEPSVDSLLSRLEALEQAVGSGVTPHIMASEIARAQEATATDPVVPGGESPLSDPEASAPDESGGDAESGQMTVAALSSRWSEFMEDLKRNRQALTATVFQEGRPVGFEDNVLKIEFPKDSDFHAREARKSRHGDALAEVLEEHFGVKPRLECRIADGPLEAPASLREEAYPEVSSEAAFGLEANRQKPAGPVERPAEVGESSRNAPDKPQAASSPGAGAAPDAAGLDDKIASEDEVFEMARERGLFGQDGGS